MRQTAPPGVVTLDLHGKNVYQARIALDAALRRAGNSVYLLRVVHGYHGGTAIADMLKGYASHPRVLRTERRDGVTALVLREW